MKTDTYVRTNNKKRERVRTTNLKRSKFKILVSMLVHFFCDVDLRERTRCKLMRRHHHQLRESSLDIAAIVDLDTTTSTLPLRKEQRSLEKVL